MVDNIDTIKNNVDNIDNYDFLDLSFKSKDGLTYAKKIGGKQGISFEKDTETYNELINELKNDEKFSNHKIINEDPLKIKVNEKNKRHFDFITCLDTIECLDGIGETRVLLNIATKLAKNFIFISQPNYDSDVTLFKKGFKTYYSDWSRHTNHLTSNIYFNLLFDIYKKGEIEDFIIFYTTPITDSRDPIIHPLNSPKNQPSFNDAKHPTKNEHTKFKNIYRNLLILITIRGFKKIDEIYDKIQGEKHVVYDSRKGIYDNSTEKIINQNRNDSKGILRKVNDFLNSDV
jgi:hypothetical protein